MRQISKSQKNADSTEIHLYKVQKQTELNSALFAATLLGMETKPGVI